MQLVEVRIMAKDDPEPAFPELVGGVNADCLGFVIYEKGTVGGKTSCGIVTQAPDGTHILVQFTGDMFLAMAAALKGARQRFGDPWDEV